MLNGVRVLDLSRVLAGPLCTMILGDLGADVIKVERPGTGDESRTWGPPFDERGESAYYLSVNRNKKSIVADLNSPNDQALIRRLAMSADVVVENFNPGMLDRRGLAPLQLLAENERLVWCTITGFGPGNERTGYDLVMQAECGWMSITGDPDGAPMKVGMALADVVTGRDAAIAILAALVARYSERQSDSGTHARHVHVSLVASATASLINVAQNALVTGKDAKRWGNQHPNLVPYQTFDAIDRSFVIAVGSDAQWISCTRALGLNDLGADTALSTNAGRIAQRERVVYEIQKRCNERTAAEWIGELQRSGVPCGLVKTVLEALREVDASALTGIAPSVPGSVRLPPPALDQHGHEIREHGWNAFENNSVANRGSALH